MKSWEILKHLEEGGQIRCGRDVISLSDLSGWDYDPLNYPDRWEKVKVKCSVEVYVEELTIGDKMRFRCQEEPNDYVEITDNDNCILMSSEDEYGCSTIDIYISYEEAKVMVKHLQLLLVDK